MKAARFATVQNRRSFHLLLRMGTLMRVRDCFRALPWDTLDTERVIRCELLSNGVVHLHEWDGTIVILRAEEFIRRADGNN
ncbi:MAG: hypothetical protein HS100_22990 [Anaerolineales bacterium]|nr:hypothetical protein [Anaerolineales bacterium]